jgi:hypothetical protein
MMLASIEPARVGLDLQTFECAMQTRTLVRRKKFDVEAGTH